MNKSIKSKEMRRQRRERTHLKRKKNTFREGKKNISTMGKVTEKKTQSVGGETVSRLKTRLW